MVVVAGLSTGAAASFLWVGSRDRRPGKGPPEDRQETPAKVWNRPSGIPTEPGLRWVKTPFIRPPRRDWLVFGDQSVLAVASPRNQPAGNDRSRRIPAESEHRSRRLPLSSTNWE